MDIILFPFNTAHDNRAAYVKAMQNAQQLSAKIIFFTSFPNNKEDELDEAYLHLLALQGYYQTHYNNWKAQPEILSEIVIQVGDFLANLQALLNSRVIDWIVPTAAVEQQYITHKSPGQFAFLVKQHRPYYPHLHNENKRV